MKVNDITGIETELFKILKDDYDIKFDISPELVDRSLFMQPFGLNYIQIYQLLLIVEERFEIYLDHDAINKYGFFVIKDIARLVQAM